LDFLKNQIQNFEWGMLPTDRDGMGHVTNRPEPLPSRRGKVGNHGYIAVFFDIFNHEMDGLFIEGWLTEGCKSSPCSSGLSATSSQNKPAISNQATLFFSQNKSTPATSNQPNDQGQRWWW
jgi:hypothetical protein